MASDWEYTYAVARIRVLETKLLTDADVNTMVSAKDAKTVITYLKDKGWGDVGVGDIDCRAAAVSVTSCTNTQIDQLRQLV